MMDLVKNKEEIRNNMITLDLSLESPVLEERRKALSLLKRGHCFIAYKSSGTIRFYPSRFIGYANNTINLHTLNESKDGKETNPIISKVLQQTNVENNYLDNEFIKFCRQLNIVPDGNKRTYWMWEDATEKNTENTKMANSYIVGSPEWFHHKAKEEKRISFRNKMEFLRGKFIDRFSPSILKNMTGDELLDKVFGDNGSMLMLLMYDDDYRDFGAAGKYKYLGIVYKEAGTTWKYKEGAKAETITYGEAKNRAIEIRDKLIYCMDTIESIEFNSISDYDRLDQRLKKVFFSQYTWVLKYYQMIYPQYFSGMYAPKTLDRALKIIGLPNHGDSKRILNNGELSLFIRRCDINNIIFGDIYADEWGWEGNPPSCQNATSNYDNRHKIPNDINLSYYSINDHKKQAEDDIAIISTIEEKLNHLGVDGKEKEAIVKVRVNQGEFRKRLLMKYNRCCLCGVADQHFLVASHIKPWSVSEADEKLDVDNGLLLCPNHDQLFDQGFISFNDNGNILISPLLESNDRIFLNVNDSMKIAPTNNNLKYLNYHRDNIFKK